jgi:hypothetical protein
MPTLAIPYTLTPAIAVETRRAYMTQAIARGLPRFVPKPATAETLYIACYGPSLRDTWEELRDKHPLLAMSGATRWLAERGIVADYVLEMDPRDSQVALCLPPVPGSTYLIASCVRPEFFDRVLAAGNPVLLWHTVSSTYDEEVAWVDAHDPGGFVVHAGQTVGIAAVHMGQRLGFSHFEIHGMDGSFGADGARHAGAHAGVVQAPDTTWAAGGHTYKTSQIMANAVAESVNVATQFPITTIWHGDGLTQALIREADVPHAACADQTAKIAALRPQLRLQQDARYWIGLMAALESGDLAELVRHMPFCAALRKQADYDTGTIPFEAAVYLRALCRRHRPQAIVEIGTFIGTSTLALVAPRIYTCDRSNDCFHPPAGVTGIQTFPRKASPQMLQAVPGPVDLFFFDGRLTAADLPEIQRLRRPESVFVLDDFIGQEKGVANLRFLASIGRLAVVGPPVGSSSSLAVLTFR